MMEMLIRALLFAAVQAARPGLTREERRILVEKSRARIASTVDFDIKAKR